MLLIRHIALVNRPLGARPVSCGRNYATGKPKATAKISADVARAHKPVSKFKFASKPKIDIDLTFDSKTKMDNMLNIDSYPSRPKATLKVKSRLKKDTASATFLPKLAEKLKTLRTAKTVLKFNPTVFDYKAFCWAISKSSANWGHPETLRSALYDTSHVNLYSRPIELVDLSFQDRVLLERGAQVFGAYLDALIKAMPHSLLTAHLKNYHLKQPMFYDLFKKNLLDNPSQMQQLLLTLSRKHREQIELSQLKNQLAKLPSSFHSLAISNAAMHPPAIMQACLDMDHRNLKPADSHSHVFKFFAKEDLLTLFELTNLRPARLIDIDNPNKRQQQSLIMLDSLITKRTTDFNLLVNDPHGKDPYYTLLDLQTVKKAYLQRFKVDGPWSTMLELDAQAFIYNELRSYMMDASKMNLLLDTVARAIVQEEKRKLSLDQLYKSENKMHSNSVIHLDYPHRWYPLARSIKRKIYLHVGPTNSGKTYHALKALQAAPTGAYAGPLRLLAWEIFETLNETMFDYKNVDKEVLAKSDDLQKIEQPAKSSLRKCNLLTGQEKTCYRDATHVSSTVELVNMNKIVDVAVVDEIQMFRDFQRGHHFTKAVLGLAAHELHLCGEEAAIPFIMKVAQITNDDLEIISYKRLCPLFVGGSHDALATDAAYISHLSTKPILEMNKTVLYDSVNKINRLDFTKNNNNAILSQADLKDTDFSYFKTGPKELVRVSSRSPQGSSDPLHHQDLVNISKARPGDCFITFSLRNIYALKREVEKASGIPCAVIYGSLPPVIRKQQAHAFNSKQLPILIATDAVGMGLNLNIGRIIFVAAAKHDGVAKRMLHPFEIRQIAGRAGRFRSDYPTGLCTAVDKTSLDHIKQSINQQTAFIRKVGLLPDTQVLKYLQYSMPSLTLDKAIDHFRFLTLFSVSNPSSSSPSLMLQSSLKGNSSSTTEKDGNNVAVDQSPSLHHCFPVIQSLNDTFKNTSGPDNDIPRVHREFTKTYSFKHDLLEQSESLNSAESSSSSSSSLDSSKEDEAFVNGLERDIPDTSYFFGSSESLEVMAKRLAAIPNDYLSLDDRLIFCSVPAKLREEYTGDTKACPIEYEKQSAILYRNLYTMNRDIMQHLHLRFHPNLKIYSYSERKTSPNQKKFLKYLDTETMQTFVKQLKETPADISLLSKQTHLVKEHQMRLENIKPVPKFSAVKLADCAIQDREFLFLLAMQYSLNNAVGYTPVRLFCSPSLRMMLENCFTPKELDFEETFAHKNKKNKDLFEYSDDAEHVDGLRNFTDVFYQKAKDNEIPTSFPDYTGRCFQYTEIIPKSHLHLHLAEKFILYLEIYLFLANRLRKPSFLQLTKLDFALINNDKPGVNLLKDSFHAKELQRLVEAIKRENIVSADLDALYDEHSLPVNPEVNPIFVDYELCLRLRDRLSLSIQQALQVMNDRVVSNE